MSRDTFPQNPNTLFGPNAHPQDRQMTEYQAWVADVGKAAADLLLKQNKISNSAMHGAADGRDRRFNLS